MANTAELFVPDLSLEADRLLVIEHAIGEGGLIDRHLKWVARGESPTADISGGVRGDYGYMPMRFCVELEETGEMRPSREPIDYQHIATSTLGLDYDVNYADLARRVAEVDEEWYKFLVDSDLLDSKQAEAMRKAGNEAYKLGAWTEDNLPTYVAEILGGFRALADRVLIKIPALEEWSRGIWSAEEHRHDVGMNEHGKMTGITNSREQVAGSNSQLRAGMEVKMHNAIQLFAYITWQELSTNYAHKRNADLLGPVGFALLSDIKADEARHHYLYLETLKALYKAFPDDTVRILKDLFTERFMPGSKGVPNFRGRSLGIHASNVFGVEHSFKAARQVLLKLELLDEDIEVEGLTAEGKIALALLRETYATEMEEKPRNGLFVLGKTATSSALRLVRHQYAKSIGLPPRVRPSAA